MTHGSLFSGIGGFDLAAEWIGWQNIFNCEWEEFPRKVLKHHFPNAKQYEDIREFNATGYAGRIDILSGGFPCQPYSTAGKRLGKEDERHLWPEMLRVIRECSPRWVVGENVRGLVNWSGGLVFEEVCADLEACGYSVQPFILPACAVNAPHRRDRVWFVAHATGVRNTSPRKSGDVERQRSEGAEGAQKGRGRSERLNGLFRFSRVVVDSNDKRTGAGFGQIQGAHGEVSQRNDDAEPCHAGDWNAPDTDDRRRPQNSVRAGREKLTVQTWSKFPTESPICGGDDGLPREWDGITFPKWRAESIKAYGNAIVPQVAFQIFEAIRDYEP